MKNSFLKKSILILTIFVVQLSYGQFGIEAGANLVSPSNTDFKQTTGYHIGLTLDLPFSDVFSFETGVFYSHKKIQDTYSDEIKLNYLDVPLTIKASFGLGTGNTKLYVAAGGFVNWGISGKGYIEGREIDIWKDEYTWLERYDFGATFGAGVEIGAIQIGAAYDMGLYNISHGDSDLRLDVIKLSLAYRFME